MNILALFIGKCLAFLGKLLGRGSSLPGYAARKIAPDFLSAFHLPPKIIMVTGTNGKTSVTKYISEFYKDAGLSVVTNEDGANIVQGIATSLIKKATMDFVVQGDVCVLEVDEGFLGTISKEIVPQVLILTNLFEDQLDRFGSAKQLAEKMASSLPENTVLYLNGNDPISVYFGELVPNKKVYYGLLDAEAGTYKSANCPKCGEVLNYSGHFYDHLGTFHCACGFKHPLLDYKAEQIQGASFLLRQEAYEAPDSPLYMIYNSLAALSYALDAGLRPERLKKVLREVVVGKGRKEKVLFNGKEGFLNLVKNPAGANLTLDLIQKEKEAYQLYFAVNNRYADGLDTEWFKEIAFEILEATPIKGIYLCGEAADALAKVIIKKLPSVPLKKGEGENVISQMKETGLKSYFLSNYTMLAKTKELLK